MIFGLFGALAGHQPLGRRRALYALHARRPARAVDPRSGADPGRHRGMPAHRQQRLLHLRAHRDPRHRGRRHAPSSRAWWCGRRRSRRTTIPTCSPIRCASTSTASRNGFSRLRVGPHHCIGNILGRTTITIAIRRLLARFPKARLADPNFVPVYGGVGRRAAPAKPADEDPMSPIAAPSRCWPHSLAVSCCRWPAQGQPQYPSQPHPADRALCAGRRAGHDRAPAGAASAGSGRPDGGGGEPRRRQRRRRGRGDRRGAGGRLHACWSSTPRCCRSARCSSASSPTIRRRISCRSRRWRARRCFSRSAPDTPVRTLPEFIDYVKARPGQVNYGSAGIGSTHHLTMEAMKSALHLDITHVPYRGTSQAVPALLGGHVQVLWASYPNLKAGVEGGLIRLLANNGTRPLAAAARAAAGGRHHPGLRSGQRHRALRARTTRRSRSCARSPTRPSPS